VRREERRRGAGKGREELPGLTERSPSLAPSSSVALSWNHRARHCCAVRPVSILLMLLHRGPKVSCRFISCASDSNGQTQREVQRSNTIDRNAAGQSRVVHKSRAVHASHVTHSTHFLSHVTRSTRFLSRQRLSRHSAGDTQLVSQLRVVNAPFLWKEHDSTGTQWSRGGKLTGAFTRRGHEPGEIRTPRGCGTFHELKTWGKVGVGAGKREWAMPRGLTTRPS